LTCADNAALYFRNACPNDLHLKRGIDSVPKKQANLVDAHVGQRVRLRRVLVGMSQERLGELLGLTFQQVQKYEKGVNRIGAGRLYEIAGILGVPIEFFYEGMEEEGAPGTAPVGGTDESHAVMDFLSSAEGIQLGLAYARIKDVKVRRKVLDLMRTLGREGEEGEGS
jgi:transcriptional regulator with XRE-family HTH domain